MDFMSIHRKENIVLTAIDLINENGIHDVSTKEIAKRLNISESTVFKIFPKKLDIINAVLDQFSLYDADMYKTAVNNNKDPMEAILFLINKYFIYYENYPAITAVLQVYDTLYHIPELQEKAKYITLHRIEIIRGLISKAQEEGRVKKDTDAGMIAIMILSSCRGFIIKWRMNEYNFPLRETTMKAVQLIIDAVRE